MSITNNFRTTISLPRLCSASSVHMPFSISSFRTMIPSVMIRPLNLFSVASVNFNGAGNVDMFN